MKSYQRISLCILLCIVLTIPSVSGCHKQSSEVSTNAPEATTQGEDLSMDDITLDGMAGDVLSTMTLEEKIGQLFIVCTDSLDFSAETSITDEMKENLARYQPGGVIFFSFNIKTPEQTKSFIDEMQKSVKIPLFIGVDEEGGMVARIGNNKEMGTTSFPTMKVIGDSGSPEEAGKVGETIGKEISGLGFNLDFAPVADVMTNEANEEIGERSFGSDPKLVSDMVAEEVKGLQKYDVSATLKHFPGQGSSGEDTHKGYVGLDVTIDNLRDTDFLPFKSGIAAEADFVMTSHVSVSQITGNDLPSSLSDIVVNAILRDELEFENVIITDAMNMKSITKFYDSDEAAKLAFQAGNDMILMPDEFSLAVEGILDAVNDGDIEPEQIDQAVLRILKVKIKRGIIPEDSAYFSS